MSLHSLTTVCPYCARVNDRQRGPGDLAPFPGALALCVGCGGIGLFTAALIVRPLTDAEERSLGPDLRAARAFYRWRAATRRAAAQAANN